MKTQDAAVSPMAFEKPILEMEDKIEELVKLSSETGINFDLEIHRLRMEADEVKQKLYQHLNPIQKLQIARHPQRPNFLEIVKMLSPETWIELHGDRSGHDDRAILGGLGEINGQPVMLIGTQKGRGMKENLVYNFGMANPEGYRKALRLFQHAEKFQIPVITLIDTPGAYPGIQGEQNGIGQAIAFNIREMARLKVPIISLVTGEASSGGALGIGVANRIYMLEHSLYTVISPEGCASILWRSAEYAGKAAEALKITGADLLAFKIIDGIVSEPLGGAHQDPQLMGENILKCLSGALAELGTQSTESLLEDRYQKFRKMGEFKVL
ncbi:MAG: acetyl-CoA carboxylase carboxyltransferase subunit alpha [Cyanobacteria bacterium]|jgi:acetyl-CoA carboxylase carboxyl transferase subunit alpha|nr:acetyl-CoA carboxylase carboxyltransferase subunit alpha [Cyanobacteriota bacterium]